MEWLGLLIILVTLCFGFVVLFGAPYLPTLDRQVETALDLVNLKPGEQLLELGCGDGKVLIAAAERGIKTVGYEINPVLFIIAWLRTRRYRKLVVVKIGNFWSAHLPETQGIFVFLLPKYMAKLDKKIIQEYSGKNVKLVSFAFKIPYKEVEQDRAGVFLYNYQ